MATTAEAAKKASGATKKSRTRSSSGKNGKARSMTDEHKAAIAEGREQARAVGRYLSALDLHKPKRGRKVTEESLKKKLDRIDADLRDADPLDRLNLLQEKKNLQKQLEAKAPEVDLKGLESEFVKVGKAYAERKGIARSTFREVGVPDDVLRTAGI